MAQFYETTKNAYRHVRGLPKPPLVLLGHTHAVWSVAFLPNGKEAISGSEDRSARRWRVKDGRELEKAMWENSGVAAVAASSDGHWIATGGQEKNITIWNAATCEKVMVLKGHTDCVRSLAFSPDSARVVSGSEDKTVVVWSATTGKRLLGPLIGHTYKVWCARFSPNGDKIASCDGGGGEMRIWNGHSGKLLLLPIEVFAASIAWTPDNQQLIVGCKDGSIKRFSALTGSLLADWKSHTDIICSIAISPNGTFFASASNDRTVRLWDTTTPTQISPPLQCDDQVCSVAISPAGTHLASGGRDNKVRIWNLTGTVSPSLLKGKPTTSNVTVRSKWSPSSPTFVMPVQQEVSSSPNDRSLEPPAPQNIIPNGKGEDPDSSVLLASDGGASSGSSKAQTPREPTQPAPWNLEDIRSNFPNDLTGSVTRRGDHPLASSSYGDVYRGTLHVRGSQIEVAVKAIRTYSADDGYDPGKTRRLNREIGVWLNLKHINILPLFGTTMGFGQFPAMVCPWLEDGPLTSYLQRRDDSLTTVERLVLVADVAVGLQYLHSQTVVHGDLSGPNVLIHGNGRACISDFGMSSLLTELGGSTLATSLHAGGTLRWAAPELLDLQVSETGENPPKVVPTPQSDIYSFGGIMLQVLTGKVPYHYFSREAQVLHAISKGEIPKRPSKELVTDDQWSFIQQCWTPIDASQSRPAGDDIVEFTRNELVKSVLPQV